MNTAAGKFRIVSQCYDNSMNNWRGKWKIRKFVHFTTVENCACSITALEKFTKRINFFCCSLNPFLDDDFDCIIVMLCDAWWYRRHRFTIFHHPHTNRYGGGLGKRRRRQPNRYYTHPAHSLWNLEKKNTLYNCIIQDMFIYILAHLRLHCCPHIGNSLSIAWWLSSVWGRPSPPST